MEQPGIATTTKEKPKWLRKLERESWQPELIISGAAIFGSLQLPDLITQMEHYFLLHYDRDTLFICYIASIYWRILANGLILTFIFHFIVRALWIGLAGLNSVYPGGFRVNQRFSAHYQDKLREEYGNVDGLIARLDRLGSGIFGVAFAVSGVFLNFGLIGLVFIVLHSWLMGQGLPADRVLLIIGVCLAPLLLLSLLSMLSHVERWRDTDIVRRFQWPITKIISRATYPLGRRFIVTATNLVTSYYADRKSFIWYYLVGMVGLTVMALSSVLFNDNTRLFVDRVYHRIAADSLMLATDYAAEASFEGIYYRPVLDREQGLSTEGMMVWIPLPEREMAYLLGDCSLPEVEESLPREERRHLTRQRTVNCGRQYMSIELNGQPQLNFSLERQYRSNAAGDQYGMRAFLPDPPLEAGKNLLRVTTGYPHEETGEPRVASLPFYYF
ncbi:uncharacterized membrane protein YuzA (DUF378 family) [Lewinella marina]|uniref:Uncharacterized protein n=1 Tax=Neolewinella marina TaxID=438751 RepID=A0A2G0CHX9_9BACT|nr:hypothetical protein [Neolewinella marina]NJB85308.1 uncharacterized membrane protein YuzA (DUF378 family) [Neolewinella marina]PHK99576.1 hypothetical protein CGL56_00530 [Neolewinella marina]